MCIGRSTVLLSRLCKFRVGNCSYISASWKQFFALRDCVITGVLHIVGLCFANDQFLAPLKGKWTVLFIKASYDNLGSTDNMTVSNQHACHHWLGFAGQTGLGMIVETISSVLNAKSHIV